MILWTLRRLEATKYNRRHSRVKKTPHVYDRKPQVSNLFPHEAKARVGECKEVTVISNMNLPTSFKLNASLHLFLKST